MQSRPDRSPQGAPTRGSRGKRAYWVPVRDAECDVVLKSVQMMYKFTLTALPFAFPAFSSQKRGLRIPNKLILAVCGIILTVESQSILNSGKAFIRIPVNGAILPEAYKSV